MSFLNFKFFIVFIFICMNGWEERTHTWSEKNFQESVLRLNYDRQTGGMGCVVRAFS